MNAPSPPIFDPAQLARQTSGNAALQTERIALFLTEAGRLMDQLDEAPDSVMKAQRARAVAGLARSIGALRLAHEARLVEVAEAIDDAALEPLRQAMAATVEFLQRGRF